MLKVIVGGTRIADDWYVLRVFIYQGSIEFFFLLLSALQRDRYPMPRPETKQDILERGLALCPELASPDIRVKRKPTIDDVLPLIISEGCGLRPARRGGIRLEVEWTEGIDGRGRVPVIHNYG